MSLSGLICGPVGVLSSLGFTMTPREVFELYPLSEIGPRAPCRESTTSRTGDLATGFLGDFGRGVDGCISTAEANGASASSSGSGTEKNDAGETGRSVTGDSARVSSMNDRLPFALSAWCRTDPSDTGEDGCSCTGDCKDSIEGSFVGVLGVVEVTSKSISLGGLTGESGGGDSANGLVGRPEMYSSAITFVLSSGGVKMDESIPGKAQLGTLPDELKTASDPGLKEKARCASGLDLRLPSPAIEGTGSSSQSLCIVLLDLTVPTSDSG